MMSEKLSRPLIVARSVTKTYQRGGWWKGSRQQRALDNVSLIVRKGQTLALIGRSGSGKTTLAMCLAALEHPDSGEIWFEGNDLASLSARELRSLRPRIHLIQQNSTTALNPRWSAREIIEEPLAIQGRGRAEERRALVHALMTKVGLVPEWQNRRPSEFSGGQRQRLGIARALALRPDLLIMDEPFSGLDLSIRGQVVNLLIELQAEYGLTYLFISHDLGLARQFASEIAVIEGGCIVEQESASCFRSRSDPGCAQAGFGKLNAAAEMSTGVH